MPRVKRLFPLFCIHQIIPKILLRNPTSTLQHNNQHAIQKTHHRRRPERDCCLLPHQQSPNQATSYQEILHKRSRCQTGFGNQSSSNKCSSSKPNTGMQPKDNSQRQWFKEKGFSSQYDFNLSYLVKPGDDEGWEEMRDLIKVMRDQEHRRIKTLHHAANTPSRNIKVREE